MSLPRSYTLPREYKYYRRNKPRKLIKNEHFITSTNSSDGKLIEHLDYSNIMMYAIATGEIFNQNSVLQVMLIAVTTMNRNANQINHQIERRTIHKDEKIISNIRRPHRRH